jgi:trimeric autotransporter adhesin
MFTTGQTDTPSSSRIGRRALIRLAVGAVAATSVVASLISFSPTTVRAATPAAPDGLTSQSAAGSCWEVKQNYPSSPNGVYWLLTPALIAPQQFYCDQTTDGGGWVLVGRGREGWKNHYNGLGSAADIRNTPSGTSAFKTAQLPSKTVDALMNGGKVGALADGIRLKRAKSADGSSWQEVRFTIPKADRWVWVFSSQKAVGTYQFDGTSGSGGQTVNFGRDQLYQRVDTSINANQGWVGGFAYGTSVTGTSSTSTYLYSATNGLGSARPFTQMYIRPKLTIATMSFPTIPDTGTSALTQRTLPESGAMPTVWGVTGQGNGVDNELNTAVAAFGQVGNTVFVGGNFKYVQKTSSATGSDQILQPFLAAFDVNTGQWISSFRPTLDNQVKAIQGLPDGRVLVGGEFGTVDGQPHAGLVVLDPVTGAVASGWQVGAENRTAGGTVQVRGFSSYGDWLYISGSFTHLTKVGGPTASDWNGARISLATGTPDVNWNPVMNGTSVGVDASQQGDRAYFVGYFRQSGDVTTVSETALQTGSSASVVQPVWVPKFSKSGVDAGGNITGNVWQLGVAESAGRVYVGGSEHSLFGYDRSSMSLASGSIGLAGGDFQTVEPWRDLIVAGCHCGDFMYQDAYAWSNIGTNWTEADSINTFGAWDAASGKYVPDYNPMLKGRKGWGVWASFRDSAGVLWAGGDIESSLRSNQVNQWSGGFARFATSDSTAPTTPTNPVVTPIDATTAQLTWSASTDDRAVTGYEVLLNNKVVATTTSRSYQAPVTTTTSRYFVRAVDAAGNRSKSTAVLNVSPPPADALEFVASGSSWKWWFKSDNAPSGWNAVGFDDSTWASGPAVLGFGSSGLGTDVSIGAPSPRPISMQLRQKFTVSDPASVVDGSISVIADDGVVVYVNGTEIGRANMPSGTISPSTLATAAPRSATAAQNRVTLAVPSATLINGTNVVAASVHANYRSTPDLSYDLRFTARRGVAPAPPAAPVVTATATGPTTATVSWTPGDQATLDHYTVTRNGVQVASPPASTTTFADTSLTPSTTYTYAVVATDTAGQHSSAGTASVTTPADQNMTLIASGSSWKWLFGSATVPSDWATTGFDDSGWHQGAATLGWNTVPLGTDISIGAPSPRPISSQYRQAFTVTDPTQLASAQLSVIANDGVIVYLNGVEIARANLPSGTITQGTYATAAPRSTTAASNPVVVAVPVSLMRAGTNVIAASTHSNYASTPDASFDLALTAVHG